MTITLTSAQAESGRLLYVQQCSSCHGDALQGGAGAALNGTAFVAKWRDRSLHDLYEIVSKQMPYNAPGTLMPVETFDILAFLLSKSGYSPTSAPLGQSTLYAVLFQAAEISTTGGAMGETVLPDLPAKAKVFGVPITTSPTAEELLQSDSNNWLIYNKDYRGQRYSDLQQITSRNAHELIAVCAFQLGQVGWYQPSPVIYGGALYVTAGSSTYAIDARTCRQLWRHDYSAAEPAIVVVNRGVAIYKGMIYRTTPTGHLIALDVKTGILLWDVWLSNTAQGHWLSSAPIITEGKVIVGEAGADFGANGHLYGFDADDGTHLWTFDLVPTGSEAGAKSWKAGASHGGGSTWTSYSADPISGLIYAPIGNPAPDYFGEGRLGDNLYSDSIVALKAATGRLAWFVQQLPHDVHDWDTSAAPVLYEVGGRNLLAAATKGGWLYVYDRDTHRLTAKSEVSTHLNNLVNPSKDGVHTCPGTAGGVQWNGPAYSPKEHALFVNSVEWCGVYTASYSNFVQGGLYLGGDLTPDPRESATGWIRKFDAATGKPIWVQRSATPMLSGLTPTAGDVLLTGDLNGDFLVLSTADGKVLYRFNTGGAIAGGISTYQIDGKQYVAVASGNASRTVWGTTGAASVFLFSLPVIFTIRE